MRTNQIKARAEELAEGYEEAKMEEFTNQLLDELDNMEFSELDSDFFQGLLDSFTFPDEWDWAFDAVQSELDDIGDQKYAQMRDER